MQAHQGNTRNLLASLIVVVGALLAAGLWPLDFDPPNTAAWARPGPGLRFGRRGIAHSADALTWPNAPAGLTLEIWLEPDEETHPHLAEILSLYDGNEIAPLLIAQWRSALIIRDRIRAEDGAYAYRELGSRDLLKRGQPQFLAIRSGTQGVDVFLDGRPTEALHSGKPLVTPGEAFGGRLLLGNSPAGTGAWPGRLYGVALYARSLSPDEIARHDARVRSSSVADLAGEPGLLALYPFDEGRGTLARSRAGAAGPISIPARFEPLRSRFLRLPRPGDRRYAGFAHDLVLNIAGFIPFGLLLAGSLRRYRPRTVRQLLIAAALAGATLSLVIEGIQVQLPGRVSSATDFACNVSGALLGAALTVVWRRFRAPQPS